MEIRSMAFLSAEFDSSFVFPRCNEEDMLSFQKLIHINYIYSDHIASKDMLRYVKLS